MRENSPTIHINALSLSVAPIPPSSPKILLRSPHAVLEEQDPPLQPPGWLGMIFYFRFLVSSSIKLTYYY